MLIVAFCFWIGIKFCGCCIFRNDVERNVGGNEGDYLEGCLIGLAQTRKFIQKKDPN